MFRFVHLVLVRSMLCPSPPACPVLWPSGRTLSGQGVCTGLSGYLELSLHTLCGVHGNLHGRRDRANCWVLEGLALLSLPTCCMWWNRVIYVWSTGLGRSKV